MTPLSGIPPPTLIMLEIVGMLFLLSKALVILQWRKAENGRFPTWQDAAWFLAPWPGMNPAAFLKRGSPVPEWIRQGFLSIVFGLGLIACAHLLNRMDTDQRVIALFVMPGLSLVLHFGIFTLVAALYRTRGYAVSLPFSNPFRARSLTGFWGTTWNRPFVELTVRLVFRPLSARFQISRKTAALAAFLASGAVHELAITLPAGSGYGGPTLYFLLQAVGWTMESLPTRAARPEWMHRAWLWAWVVIPLPLLFPSPFIFEVMFPIAGLHP